MNVRILWLKMRMVSGKNFHIVQEQHDFMHTKRFFSVAAEFFHNLKSEINIPKTWCSWTTFERLKRDSGYWVGEFPSQCDILDWGIRDCGNWVQPFPFHDIAHVIIPREFRYDDHDTKSFDIKVIQDVDGLSSVLNKNMIPHRVNLYFLEFRGSPICK